MNQISTATIYSILPEAFSELWEPALQEMGRFHCWPIVYEILANATPEPLLDLMRQWLNSMIFVPCAFKHHNSSVSPINYFTCPHRSRNLGCGHIGVEIYSQFMAIVFLLQKIESVFGVSVFYPNEMNEIQKNIKSLCKESTRLDNQASMLYQDTSIPSIELQTAQVSLAREGMLIRDGLLHIVEELVGVPDILISRQKIH